MRPATCRSVSLVLAFSCAAAAAWPASAIVVRHDVPDAAYIAGESGFPAVFSLYRTRAGHRDCMATLIGPRHALTAAHCTEVKKLRDAAGPGKEGYPVEIGGREAVVEAVIHAPARSDGTRPDIAILRLRSPVAHVKPMPLPTDGSEVGRIVQIPGWGGKGNGRTGALASDGVFRVAENRVERAESGRLYWTFDDPSKGTALSLEGISGPGDSGGPALLLGPDGWYVAGVSSAQRTMGGPEGVYGVEEVFVRVSDFVEWIEASMAGG